MTTAAMCVLPWGSLVRLGEAVRLAPAAAPVPTRGNAEGVGPAVLSQWAAVLLVAMTGLALPVHATEQRCNEARVQLLATQSSDIEPRKDRVQKQSDVMSF